MSEPKKTLKKTASNSSINTAAGSEDESGKVASRSAYFNVFPDPNVPGNHVTVSFLNDARCSLPSNFLDEWPHWLHDQDWRHHG